MEADSNCITTPIRQGYRLKTVDDGHTSGGPSKTA